MKQSGSTRSSTGRGTAAAVTVLLVAGAIVVARGAGKLTSWRPIVVATQPAPHPTIDTAPMDRDDHGIRVFFDVRIQSPDVQTGTLAGAGLIWEIGGLEHPDVIGLEDRPHRPDMMEWTSQYHEALPGQHVSITVTLNGRYSRLLFYYCAIHAWDRIGNLRELKQSGSRDRTCRAEAVVPADW